MLAVNPARTVRNWLTAVLGTVTALLLLTASAAHAADTFVEVTPDTAQPGTRVNIRASCDQSNDRQASVESEAFGRVVVRPDNGFLTGAVTIPSNRSPGSYEVRLDCPDNGGTATTTLNVVNMSKPTQGPATGGGGTAGGPGGFGGPLVLAGGLAIVTVGAGLWLTGQRRGRAGLGH